MMELWELVARERIRDTLARYNWSGDGLRLDDLAGTFCEGGALEVRGWEPFQGREAIVAFLGGAFGAPRPEHDETRGFAQAADASVVGTKRIVRHNLTNVRFHEVTRERALVASYFTVVTEIGLDHHGRYRDTLVPVGDDWLFQHRFVSTDWRAPGSTMAPASSVT